MHEETLERRVAAAPERVWAVLTDLDRAPEVLTAVESVEVHTEPPFGLGTRWTETRTAFGRQATETMEVVEVEPGRRYVVEAVGTGSRYRSEFRVEPDGDGTRLVMTFGAEPLGMVARAMAATIGRLFEGATRKALAADLDDIARASETAA